MGTTKITQQQAREWRSSAITAHEQLMEVRRELDVARKAHEGNLDRIEELKLEVASWTRRFDRVLEERDNAHKAVVRLALRER